MQQNSQNILGLSKPAVCVVGPTASGKSELAQQYALKAGGEVVSCDSMQIYRGMDIGTGKVVAEQQLVPHWGIDLIDPGEPYSAALFQEYARQAMVDIDRRGHVPILCGGTGFYVRATIDGYDFVEGEQVGNEVRERYNALAQEKGPLHVWELLNEVDPESANIIPPNDTKRVVRAFEILNEGTTYARQKENLAHIPQVVPAIMVGLLVDRDVLNARINKRVDHMVEIGLIDEVKQLLGQGFREGITAPQAIGYKEIVAALDGDITLDEAVEKIKLVTRRYAKRQRTWFRKDARIHWVDANDGDVERMLAELYTIVEGELGK